MEVFRRSPGSERPLFPSLPPFLHSWRLCPIKSVIEPRGFFFLPFLVASSVSLLPFLFLLLWRSTRSDGFHFLFFFSPHAPQDWREAAFGFVLSLFLPPRNDGGFFPPPFLPFLWVLKIASNHLDPFSFFRPIIPQWLSVACSGIPSFNSSFFPPTIFG